MSNGARDSSVNTSKSVPDEVDQRRKLRAQQIRSMVLQEIKSGQKLLNESKASLKDADAQQTTTIADINSDRVHQKVERILGFLHDSVSSDQKFAFNILYYAC